jgi:hypothetical protein
MKRSTSSSTVQLRSRSSQAVFFDELRHNPRHNFGVAPEELPRCPRLSPRQHTPYARTLQATEGILFRCLELRHFAFLISAIEGWRGFQSSLQWFDRQFDRRKL